MRGVPADKSAAMMAPKQKVEKPMRIMGRLFGYILRRYKLHCLGVLLFIFGSTAATVAGNLFMKTLIDDYIVPYIGEGGASDFGPLLAALLKMGCVFLFGVLCTLLYNRIMVYVSQGTMRAIRDDLFRHMERLPIRYFDTHAHGDIMSIYTNDIDTLRQMISQSLPNLLQTIIVLATVLGIMFYFSAWMGLVIIAGVAVMTFLTKLLGSNSARFFIAQQMELGVVEGHIEEVMNGQKVVKAFCHERTAEEDFDERNEKLFEVSQKANMFANILMPILMNLGNLIYVMVALAGGVFLALGVPNLSFSGLPLSIAVVVPFLNMTKQFCGQIGQVSQQINAVVMGLAGAERIFELLDQEPEVDEGYVTLVDAQVNPDTWEIEEADHRTGLWAWKHPHKADGTVTYVPLRGDVRMVDVDFGYTPDHEVLHGVSVYAKPGQKVAFVGATGAGKTTITNLINRFYDIADGKIRYDGINVNKIKKADLRRSLGVVLQDVNLFTGTVMDNIRYGKLDATDEECIKAAELAGADDFIRRLPDGYNTMLTGNGSQLSQGQRQLVSIARAAVADPPAMILDEATSSIDTRTEAIVQRGMDALMQGRTTFVIAHRLSTVRNSDVIICLDHGRVIERGTHDELIAKKGYYYQLYTGAFELE